MLTTDNRRYAADEGCFIVRKSDQKIMGEAIDLGSDDNIENYEDQAYTEESYREFYAGIGIDVTAENEPQKRNKEGKWCHYDATTSNQYGINPYELIGKTVVQPYWVQSVAPLLMN